MANLSDFFVLWLEIYGANRKSIANKLGVSASKLSRIEHGQSALTFDTLKQLGDLSKSSLNSLVIACLLMDENVHDIDSDDPGDRLIKWLYAQLADQARMTETDGVARHFLGKPAAIESIFNTLDAQSPRAEILGLKRRPLGALKPSRASSS
jgi:transcriptional regulator with XRE-family HTH domain